VVHLVAGDTAHIAAVMTAAFPRGMRLIAGVARETHAADLRRGHLAGRVDVLGLRRLVVLGGVTVTRIAGGRVGSLHKSRRLSVRAHREGRSEVLVARKAFLPCRDGSRWGLLFLRRRCLLLRDRDRGTHGYQEDSGKYKGKNNCGMPSRCKAARLTH